VRRRAKKTINVSDAEGGEASPAATLGRRERQPFSIDDVMARSRDRSKPR